MEEEIWKDIVGYEGKYLVSSMGNIKSLNYENTGNSQNLKLQNSGGGYKHVDLYNENIDKIMLVHRLVAIAFIPNPEKKPTVNHKDGNVENNYIDNLEWMTYSENHKHAYDTLGRVHSQLGKTGVLCTSSKPVNQYSIDGTLIKMWDAVLDVTRELGYDNSAICHCCNGVTKTSYGFKWKFA